MVSAGRFFSHHDYAIVYFDSRHRVTKTKFEGGMMGELVEEVQPEDIFTSFNWPKRSYRQQLETVNGGEGVSVIEFELGSRRGKPEQMWRSNLFETFDLADDE